jgi:tRNA dimethylallyltransferase
VTHLIAIVGPTAAGKSTLGVSLARRFGGEIVACDSTQVYRGFDIGTAKPTVSERQGVPHHLIDLIEPAELFTAADYRRRAMDVLEDLRRRGRLPIFTAGTGLYLRALLAGLSDAPARSSAFRARLDAIAARRGAGHLHRLLRRVDGAAAVRISPQDAQKLVRALEIRFLTGKPLSDVYRAGRAPLEGYMPLKIGLNPPRALLYERIEKRTHAMLDRGWRGEVESLLASSKAPRQATAAVPILDAGPDSGRNTGPLGGPDTDEVPLTKPAASPALTKPFEFIGYREMRAHIESGKPLPETIAAIAQATRRYAKRQLTWFRKEPGVQWFSGFGDDPEIAAAVAAEIARYLASNAAPPVTPLAKY